MRATASRLKAWFESDFFWDFSHEGVAVASFCLLVFLCLIALCAPVIAPQDPFDLASIDIAFANLPPSWAAGGDPAFVLGTDDQGRDLLSAILYGMRLSIAIGLVSVFLSVVLGVVFGLLAGFAGGVADAVIMRVCDAFLSFPAILIALLIDGILKAALPQGMGEATAYCVLVFAITLSGWVKYARTVRSLTLVEKDKEYVLAARVIGVSRTRIVFRHILPNVLSPLFVLATVGVATAIMTESTLSFLGVGVPPTTPSLGSLIRIGNDYLFSGQWWLCIFPGAVLVAIVMAVNLFGDWLRDATNPELKG